MLQTCLRSASLLCLALVGCQSPPLLEGSGRIGKRPIELDRPITSVLISNGLTADLLQLSSGGEQEAVLSGDDNLLDQIEVSQEEGQLSFQLREGVRVRSKLGLKLTASLSFDHLKLSNSSTAHLRLSGRLLKLNLMNSSSVTAEGRLGSLDLQATNSSRFDFSKSPVRDASIRMVNASEGTVEVRHRIKELELRNASTLKLLGSPTIDQQSVENASRLIRLE